MIDKASFNEAEFIAGFLATIFLAWIVALFMKWVVKKNEKLRSPEGVDDEKWQSAFQLSKEQMKPTKILGFFEAIIIFISLYIGKPEVIAGWLTFKLASKWQTWNAIMRLPEKIDGIDDIEYIGAKNQIASATLQRWLIGTLGNILAGFFGLMMGIGIIKGLILLKLIICK